MWHQHGQLLHIQYVGSLYNNNWYTIGYMICISPPSYCFILLGPQLAQMPLPCTRPHHQSLPPSLTPPLLLPHPLHPLLLPSSALAQPISSPGPKGCLTFSWEAGPTVTETVPLENVRGKYGRILPPLHHITTCLLLPLMPLGWSRSMEMPYPVGLTIGACWQTCTPLLASSFSRSSPATLREKERTRVKTQVFHSL